MTHRLSGMVHPGPSILQHVRNISSRFFYHFGIHCATHQIRMILISSVVITSLFYPALAIYSSSFPHAQKSTSILDSFLAASAVSGFYAQHDLRNLWEGHQALRVVEDAVSRAKCGKQRTLRVERVLIQSPVADDSDSGTLNHQILESTLKLEQSISKVLTSRKQNCLRKPDGQCFVLSPLAFWHHSSPNLRSDTNILDTLNLSGGPNNISIAGIPLSPSMVVARRGSYEFEPGNKFDYAEFLALTYFFPDLDCFGSGEHMAWMDAVRDAVARGTDIDAETQEPTLIALEYDTSPTRPSYFSAISLFLCLAYVTFFIYVGRSMRDMVAVHSRIGLTFTALVEIAVSTITSLSVCALVGFRVTMVPWELLPIVIVFVGAENMFSLVDAVTRTPITLAVKQRIAVGLSNAGTSNTLKVVSYNAILGVLAVLAGRAGAGAIAQFCAFAIVVLVAHWFLAHTFFLAVLSIDIQRLELDELLRQDTSLASVSNGGMATDGAPLQSLGPSNSRWQKFTRGYFRRRVTKDISLVLLLTMAATLYYTTSPASSRVELETNPSPRGALSRGKTNINLPSVNHPSPAWNIWKTLNPDEDPLLHLRIEMPTIVTFRSELAGKQVETDTKQKVSRPHFPCTLKSVLWFFKIVVLPITATTTALYFLCLYLLKDAELLEAQRNRAESSSLDPDAQTPLQGRIMFTTVPRAFSTDVELLAASKDGRVIASVGMHNELAITWRRDHENQTLTSIDTTDVLLGAASTSSAASAITALSVDEKAVFCAVGTGAGVIAVWSIEDGRVMSLPHLVLESSSSGIVELQFAPTTSTPTLIAIYENGTAAKWIIDDISALTYLTPRHPERIIKCTAIRVHADNRLLVAFSMQDGSLELTEITECGSILLPDCLLHAGNPADTISQVGACSAEFGGIQHLIIGAATGAGAVSLWDGRTGECIYILDDVYGKISNLRISPVPCEICRYCGELPVENFTVSFSVGNIVLFHRAYLSVPTRRCACTRGLPPLASARDIRNGRRSRSNSLVSSGGSISPANVRLRLSATNTNTQAAHDTSSFPISGHGIRSRRTSDKDALRRTENTTLPLVTDEHESSHPVGPLDVSTPLHSPRISTTWRNLVVIRLTELSCDRGSWDILESNIVGVRRKARSHGKPKDRAITQISMDSSHSLTTAALDRWELWTFDPSSSRLQSSPLTALIDHHPTKNHLHSHASQAPRLPFTRVSPFLSSGSHGFGGFGNTVGVFNFLAS